jgi:thiol:disulfide interchange protein DsbC
VPRSDAIILGSRGGAHRVVAFVDPDCAYCVKLHARLETLTRDRSDVRIELRMFPLPMHGESAKTAAKVALYASRSGQGDAFMRAYYHAEGDADARLAAAMAEARVDPRELDRIKQDRGIEADLARDIAAGRAAHVSGTPSLFIDGQSMVGAQPLEDIVAMLDDKTTTVE